MFRVLGMTACWIILGYTADDVGEVQHREAEHARITEYTSARAPPSASSKTES